MGKQRSFMLRPTALDRFIDKCVFNPFTGCVLWIGGVSYGGRQSNPYPTFWDGEKTVRGHIWAAENIHGIVRQPGDHVDHECRCTLCVEHLRALHGSVNQALGTQMRSIPVGDMFEGVPFYQPPVWVKRRIPIVTSMRQFVRRKNASRSKATTLC